MLKVCTGGGGGGGLLAYLFSFPLCFSKGGSFVLVLFLLISNILILISMIYMSGLCQ